MDEILEILGTAGDDLLVGTVGRDQIFGFGGFDDIFGAFGDDTLLGGVGADLLSGEGSSDVVLGEQGNDTLFGDSGDDTLFGNLGNDELNGGNGADELIGGAGSDILRGGNARDFLEGDIGADVLSGGNGADDLSGGRGNDLLVGGQGRDGFFFDPSRTQEGRDLVRDFELGIDRVVLDVAEVLASTPGLGDAIVAGGGDINAVFAALDDSADWVLSGNAVGDLVINHPNGSIVLEGIPLSGITSFADLSGAITITDLGDTLSTLAEASGNPATIADVVAGSGGTPDDNDQDFDLLLTALEATGLTATLADPDASFSVLAPNDAAFVSLAQRLGFGGTDEGEALTFILDALAGLDPDGDPIPVLTDVLLFHVIPEARTFGELQFDIFLSPALEDSEIVVAGGAFIDEDDDFTNARAIAEDIQTGNGVIQVVNEVLLPIDI